MKKFAIASLQLELKPEDNVALICDEVRLVHKRFPWVDMVLVAELAAFGTSLRHAQPMPGPAEHTFCALARETGLWVLPGSIYEIKDERIYNTAPVINPAGEVVARCRKMFPFLPYEVGVASGEDFTIFDVEGAGRFGVSICYDMWFPETTRSLVCMGAEVILHPSLTNTIDRDAELAIARASAAMNQCYFLDINSTGRLAFGRSIIAGPGGEVIHQAGTDREIMPVEIDFDHVRRVRQHGWQNLGQPLKSFRDAQIAFPAYRQAASFSSLKALGPLVKPMKNEPENNGEKQ